MKKLSKISLSDVRVMDVQEMKMILGGNVSDDSECHIAGGSGSSFGGGTGSNNEEVKCSGVCGPKLDVETGTMKPKKCQSVKMKGWGGGYVYICDCI